MPHSRSQLLLVVSIAIASIGTHVHAQPDAKPEEPLSELIYPGATTWNGTIAGSTRAFVHNTVMATTDDVDTVVTHYKEKTGHDLSAEKLGATKQRVSGRDGSWSFFHDDSAKPSSDQARDVVVRYFAKDTLEEHITLIITKAATEQHTHIILTHTKKTTKATNKAQK